MVTDRTTSRIDPKFKSELRSIMNLRFQNGLASFNSKDLGMAEATRLILKTPSWKNVTEELKKLPRKEL